MTARETTILFAGGGTGGHIFPNVAIVERLREMGVAAMPHFLVSQRSIDHQILAPMGFAFTALAAQPWRVSPVDMARFTTGWFAAQRQVRSLIRTHRVAALVATGGFVSAPAIIAAKRAGVPVALVNLDAVPGKANSRMARHADVIFSVYDTSALLGAQRIGMPLRRLALGPDDPAEARRRLGLDPERPTLLVTGGSQGAQLVSLAVIELLRRDSARQAMADWQILHVCGPANEMDMRAMHEKIGLPARVVGFCDRMGDAWRAATLAISRAGAGSVAEAWANATPTIFFPYPGHVDEHQRLNAQPMVDTGGAVLLKDQRDPVANADAMEPVLLDLVRDPAKCETMRRQLRKHEPGDGAARMAQWLAQVQGSGFKAQS